MTDMIRFTELQIADYPLVKSIYDHYILNSTATFHTVPLSIDELKELIPIGHSRYRSYLIRTGEGVCGFCYFSAYKKRQAYDRSSEVTVYLKPEYLGKGIGKQALMMMEDIARQNGIKVLLGIIAGDNAASMRLFEACGFEQCARFKEVGEKFGSVLDVLAYQKNIDHVNIDQSA